MFEHMIPQLTRVCEHLPADTARDIRHVLVNSCLVLFESAHRLKCVAAVFACVAFGVLVLIMMRLQLAWVDEATVTQVTHMRPPLHVHSHMTLDVTRLGKRPPTHLTSVWLHVAVRQCMRLKMTRLFEQFPTDLTAVRFDSVMPEDVRNKVMLRTVDLWTHETFPTALSIDENALAFFDVHADIHAFR